MDSRKGLAEAGPFESYLRSQIIYNLALVALCLRSVSPKRKLRNFDSRSSHLIRYNITVNVHRGSDVRVAHHLLLDSHGSTHRIEP